MDSIESRVAAAMEQLRQTEEAAERAQGDLSAMTETARSRDGSVEATVSAQGRVEAVRFLDNRHRAMSGDRLSAATVEAIETAQAAMARVVMETMRPLTEMADAMARAVSDEAGEAAAADWEQMFAPLRETAARGQEQGDQRGKRLRDELHEGE
ncbi:YbaB/EbfC family nucleoid-associated protein [Streptomyces bohaiensis]|uniref:YbaB/EbfC family nucleoid-associated protein n=1 Tax=Streptomyces bohaiensis TaxID=1431344 RepID=A0ABX1CA41_9ACTN|nr:YbaB/EbfC family nucleoid-associated protein [Streptomyces bohaiensis]NJQ16006.1 YbaB/EbfC family nucleoid-associated protein [Streptomyces bohaiensis]